MNLIEWFKFIAWGSTMLAGYRFYDWYVCTRFYRLKKRQLKRQKTIEKRRNK